MFSFNWDHSEITVNQVGHNGQRFTCQRTGANLGRLRPWKPKNGLMMANELMSISFFHINFRWESQMGSPWGQQVRYQIDPFLTATQIGFLGHQLSVYFRTWRQVHWTDLSEEDPVWSWYTCLISWLVLAGNPDVFWGKNGLPMLIKHQYLEGDQEAGKCFFNSQSSSSNITGLLSVYHGLSLGVSWRFTLQNGFTLVFCRTFRPLCEKPPYAAIL